MKINQLSLKNKAAIESDKFELRHFSKLYRKYSM